MSILIKDMEMPANCYNCWLGHKCPKYEALLWNEVNKERKADCPLVPVPPHGDLIERDALKHKIYFEIPFKGFKNVGRVSDMVLLVCDAPTIIEEER